jgi:hypothetical protein
MARIAILLPVWLCVLLVAVASAAVCIVHTSMRIRGTVRLAGLLDRMAEKMDGGRSPRKEDKSSAKGSKA